MLAKILFVSVLAIAVMARGPWESFWSVSGWGSKVSINASGASDQSEASAHGDVLPSDDCDDFDSRACQNFNELRLNGINNQINMELTASYTYMAMAAYFSRDDPDHKGFAKFFSEASTEEREHALKLVEYLNQRGGKARFSSISAPSKHEWTNGLQAMEEALNLEKEVNKSLLRLHELADGDPHMQDFLESNYLNEQVESIRQLSGYVSKLRRLRETNPGLGEHIFDKEL